MIMIADSVENPGSVDRIIKDNLIAAAGIEMRSVDDYLNRPGF